jgi:hypothetical protein
MFKERSKKQKKETDRSEETKIDCFRKEEKWMKENERSEKIKIDR